MKNLTPEEKEALRQKIKQYHEDRTTRIVNEMDKAEFGNQSKTRRLGFRTANPALNSKIFAEFESIAGTDEAMSINGTVSKTFFMLLLLWIAAMWMWVLSYRIASPVTVGPWVLISSVAGFIVAFVTISRKHLAHITAPIYAILEGLVLGGFSSLLNARFPGIAVQAVGLTFGTLLFILIAYKSGIIKVTQNFRLGIVAATGGIAMVYIFTLFIGLLGLPVPYIHESGIIGIAFSLFVVVIAALNLVLDFDFIEKGAADGAPKYMEWYAAFGLMITLIWLYLEIIRLLAKARRR